MYSLKGCVQHNVDLSCWCQESIHYCLDSVRMKCLKCQDQKNVKINDQHPIIRLPLYADYLMHIGDHVRWIQFYLMYTRNIVKSKESYGINRNGAIVAEHDKNVVNYVQY